MLEHVGRSNYPLYMETASHLLKDGGMFLLHYISGHDESIGNPWMRKYIFRAEPCRAPRNRKPGL